MTYSFHNSDKKACVDYRKKRHMLYLTQIPKVDLLAYDATFGAIPFGIMHFYGTSKPMVPRSKDNTLTSKHSC